MRRPCLATACDEKPECQNASYVSWRLLRKKGFGGNDSLNQVLQPVVGLRGTSGDFFERGVIDIADRPTEGVGEQRLLESADEFLLLGQERGFVAREVAELAS